MNKKVLTLCAGFMLAGGLVNFVSAENLKDYQSVDKVTEVGSDAYFLVMEQSGNSYAYGSFVDADGEIQQDVNEMGVENEVKFEDLNRFMWKVTEIELSASGTPAADKEYGYALQNVATGKYLSIASDGTISFVDKYDRDNESTYVVQNGYKKYAEDAQWIPGSGSNYFVLDASNNNAKVITSSSVDWTFNLYEVEDKEISDTDDLNDLYNSTGFNLVLNQDKWKDVANIFDDQRVKAIKVPSGVTSPVTSETDYAFPEGTYFVVSTPAEVQPQNGGEDLYNWLQQCTFIAVASTENDINSKADREAGKGFMLTTVSGRDLVKYQGTDKSKRAHGSRIAVNNACFTVYKNLDNQYAILVDELWYNKNKAADIKDTDEQAKATTALSLNVTEKVGEDNDDLYLTTDSNDKKFIFAMEEVFTQKALDWLNTDGMAAYNIQFVSGDAENMYLYCTAYDNKAYAKGINFIDIDTPEAQFVITDVNEDDNSLTFTNRANRNQSITVKLYEEADDVYSIAVDKDDQANDNFYVVSVDQNGNLVTASESLDIHGQWAKITPATVDQFAGTWDVDNLTEVTMSFARDENSTSNRLFVHADANTANQLQTLKVSNTLTDAVQFQLRKSSKPTYLTNIYAYKIGDKVNYRSEGDTVAYYTYQLQAYRDGHAIERYLKWNGTDGAYELADAGDWFIIKDNKDGSVSILTTDEYDHTDFIAVEGYNWTSGSDVPSIKDFEGKSIKYGNLNEAVDAVDVKTYLNVESPETSLDPKSTYVTLVTEDDDYVAIKDNRDGIISGEETTLRLFVTDTDRQIPSFLVSNGWNEENGERMFLFNSVDSVNYNVATGEFDKEYALQGNHNLNKAIFRPGKLSETNTANDTLFTTIKGKETAVTNVASNTENAQAGLNRYKFQIVADEENEGYYIVRQEGYYLFNVNSKLVFANSDQFNRTNALRVKVTNVESPTANETINAANNSVVVAGVNGAVVVKGAEGKNVIVSTILGKVVANEVVSSDNATIAAPAGIVVVSVDGESFKVVVK